MKFKFDVIIAFASQMANNLPNYFEHSAIFGEALPGCTSKVQKQAFLPTGAFANKLSIDRKINK